MAEYHSLDSANWFTRTFNPSNIFVAITSLSSIFGFLLVIKIPFSDDAKLFALFLIILIVVLLAYIYYYHITKPYKYAICSSYMHQVNHILRDHLAKVEEAFKSGSLNRKTEGENFISTMEQCLTITANMFDVLTGRRCGVAYKQLILDDKHPRPYLKTVARDYRTRDHRKYTAEEGTIHCIDDNTDFYDLFFGKNQCSNYFFENNLPKLWKKGLNPSNRPYKNSSFKLAQKEPELYQWGDHLGLQLLKSWPLQYKSAMVFPIRFGSVLRFPPHDEPHAHPMKYSGFLCIDCGSKNVFNDRLQIDLGAALADLFYIFISQYAFILLEHSNSAEK
ncbi:MAG: hypothetical protein FWG04_04105 [Desulfovibrionaceae bacterium]|nr:hypothetical protein [Desulfovibrionaceae bacterium]